MNELMTMAPHRCNVCCSDKDGKPQNQSTMASFEFLMESSAVRGDNGGKFDRPYVAYHIRCKVVAQSAATTFEHTAMEPFRRYSDFVWLRGRLVGDFPYCVIPPIPGKGSALGAVAGGVPPGEVVHYRQRALRKFLAAVGAHPRLQTSNDFKDFLEMHDDAFERKKHAAAKPGGAAGAAGDGFLSAVWSVFSASWSPPPLTDTGASIAEVLSPGALPAAPNLWLEVHHYATQMQESLAALQGRVEQLVAGRKGTGGALRAFADAMAGVGRPVAGEGVTAPHDRATMDAMATLAGQSAQLGRLSEEQAAVESRDLLEALLYAAGLVDAVRETLKRLQASIDNRDAVADRHRAATQAVQACLQNGGAKAALIKAESELRELDEARRQSETLAETYQANFRDDFRRCYAALQLDMRAMLRRFVEMQVAYGEEMLRCWDEAER
jgi:hypothetical protein